MCGLAGFLTSSPARFAFDETLARMGGELRHRGPDGGASWSDADAGIGLAHRRLAIVELSDAGRQPMRSHSGRFVVSYNGEIYNHRALRARLEAEGRMGAPWTGTSDTETLLAAVDAWGVDRAIEAAVGMFALALWDRQERRLWLARDRLGEKPLYYGVQDGVLLFGSELKTFRAHPAFRAKIDPAAAEAMLRYGYVPAPLSIYEGIAKLPAGSLLEIDMRSSWAETLPAPRQYWSVVDSFAQARAKGLLPDEPDTSVELERLLSVAIGDQMMADVPLGAFLSGGIDSSLITALMQAQHGRPVRTFTIGFAEAEMNEAHAAKAIARHLGTDHTEFYVSPQDSLDLIPRLPEIYDEPFADASQIPTQIMCRMARQHVTVALSGDGGDELFGGYNRHIFAGGLAERVMLLPAPVRGLIAHALTALPRNAMASLAAKMRREGRGTDPRQLVRKLEKVISVLRAASGDVLYDAFVEHSGPQGSLVDPVRFPAANRHAGTSISAGGDLAQQFMLRDMMQYLPDDVLVKVDRAAMSVSLETRAPFLDHRLVEFSHRLPPGQKVRDGKGKRILREILARHVPPALFERPKMGFSVPIDTWLRGPLRDWAESLLSNETLAETGYLRAPATRTMWDEHLSGRRNWSTQIWSVLMFQAWLTSQDERLAPHGQQLRSANG